MSKKREKRNKYSVEYKKQRRRVQRAIRELRKQGYNIPNDALPPIPKSIRQGSINRLSKITRSDLKRRYSKPVKVSKTNVSVEYIFDANEQIVNRFLEIALSYFNSSQYHERNIANFLYFALDNLVSQYGIGVVAERIHKTTSEIEFEEIIQDSKEGYIKAQALNEQWLSGIFDNGTVEEFNQIYSNDDDFGGYNESEA